MVVKAQKSVCKLVISSLCVCLFQWWLKHRSVCAISFSTAPQHSCTVGEFTRTMHDSLNTTQPAGFWLMISPCVARQWSITANSNNYTCVWGGAGYTAIHVCGEGLVTQQYVCVGRGWLHSYTCVWGGTGYTASICGKGLVTQLYMCVGKGWLHGNAHWKMSIHQHTQINT